MNCQAVRPEREPRVVAHSNASAEAALVAAERKLGLLVYLCPRFG